MNNIKKIVVGTDFSEATTEPLFRAALTVARAFQASVDLVHVREFYLYPITGGQFPSQAQMGMVFNWIDESLSRLAARFIEAGVPCVTTSLEGPPHSQLVSHAEKAGADLIIVGTHGRSGFSHAILG